MFLFAASSAALIGQKNTVPLCAPDDPSLAKTELQRYYDEETQIKEQEIQAHTDYESDKLRCKGSTGSAANTCLQKAGKTLERNMAKAAIRRNNNNNVHTKATTGFAASKDRCNVTGNSFEEQNENWRHFDALIAIKKKAIDVETKYGNAKLQCVVDAPPAPDCTKKAETQYAKDKIQIQIDINDENGTWTKNRTGILRNETRPK